MRFAKNNFRLLSWTAAVFVGIVLVVLLALLPRRGQPSSLAYAGTPLDEVAADFDLSDQTGARVSLSDLRGQVVVLTFFDSQCKDRCPLTAAELRTASQKLGDQAKSVAFVAVNVNLAAHTVADVAAATHQWRLHEIPIWHFLTGSPAELAPVWAAYHVAVMPAEEDADELMHTPGVYVIDQAGRTRWYISTPLDPSGSVQMTAPLSDLLVNHIQALLEESPHG